MTTDLMTQPECPARVVDLAHRRWVVPVLAQLHHARVTGNPAGTRTAGLLHRLGVGRQPLRESLEYATAHGWLRRNPGHGHPLRPELVLTPTGAATAAGCDRLWRAAVLRDLTGPIGRKWTLPVLRALASGPSRYGEIKAALSPHGMTDRALSMALRSMAGWGLVERRVTPDRPPVVTYEATDRASALVRAAARL